MILVLAAIAIQASTIADRPFPLMPGDAAPALHVSSWIQGQPVTSFEKGKVYVLDFWATWCGPCITAIPDLNKLSHTYKDRVTFVGIDVWEPHQEAAGPFIKQMGNDMTYPVSQDAVSPDKLADAELGKWMVEQADCSKDWLVASGTSNIGIPQIFVINGEGKIAWIGDDTDELSRVLPSISSGKWDLPAFRTSYALQMGKLAQGWKMREEIKNAQDKKQWDKVIDLCNQIVNLGSFESYNVVKFQTMFFEMNDRKGALNFGETLLANSSSLATLDHVSNALAFADITLSTDEIQLAGDLAKKANDLTSGEVGVPLEILARVAFLRKDFAEAVRLQDLAVQKTTSAKAKATAQDRLLQYRKAAGTSAYAGR
jgi:thiol-disulfide isomerase/thioredoxin